MTREGKHSCKHRCFANGTISLRHGSEGPRYDPYSYTEYEMKRGANSVLLHLGLVTYVQLNSHDKGLKETDAVRFFEQACGISLKTFERTMQRIIRCCDKPDLVNVEGFPGESLLYCQHCDKVVDCDFNHSAIV